MTLEETALKAGLPQSAGMPDFKDYRPPLDGPIATRIFGAGVCLLGKTKMLKHTEGGLLMVKTLALDEVFSVFQIETPTLSS